MKATFVLIFIIIRIKPEAHLFLLILPCAFANEMNFCYYFYKNQIRILACAAVIKKQPILMTLGTSTYCCPWQQKKQK